MTDIADLREEYHNNDTDLASLQQNPLQQFDVWFKEALSGDVKEANAMSLATVDKNGQPSSRIILLKYYDEDGFTFFTNYHSRKASDLNQNPKGCLLFWWREMQRQVRIEGTLHKCSDAHSDDYFAGRPKTSNIGAYASHQSEVVKNREQLMQRFEYFEQKFADTEQIPRPEFWGGYVLTPHAYEFWQGREYRMHDRFLYTLKSDQWIISRLAP
jgi:pyridoxamine 5'-phosphate oxidase